MKKSMFIDLDTGAIGTFAGMKKEDTQEPGYVTPTFYPLNSLSRKELRNPVRQKDIIVWHPSGRGNPGIEEEYLIHSSGNRDGSMIAGIELKHQERIKDLEGQIRGMKIEITNLQQEVTDAKSGVQKQQARLNESTSKRRLNELENTVRVPKPHSWEEFE